MRALDRRSFHKRGFAALLTGSVFHGSSAGGQAPTIVRAISSPTDAAKQVLYAQQAGLLAKRGLQLELSSLSNGAAGFAAIVGGSAEFASGALFSVFQAYGRGVPLRVIAPISVYDTNRCDAWMMVRKDGPIHEAADLAGKIMGADSTNDIYLNATRVWCDRHGGDGKTLKAVELRPTAQLPALLDGRIDVVVLRPPYLTVALQSGKVRVIGKPLDVIAPRYLLSCWVAASDYIVKNPVAVQAFVEALMEASRYVDKHQAETVDMVAKFTGQDPVQIAQGVRAVLADSVTVAEVQRPLDFAYKYGAIDKQYDARDILAPAMPLTKG